MGWAVKVKFEAVLKDFACRSSDSESILKCRLDVGTVYLPHVLRLAAFGLGKICRVRLKEGLVFGAELRDVRIRGGGDSVLVLTTQPGPSILKKMGAVMGTPVRVVVFLGGRDE